MHIASPKSTPVQVCTMVAWCLAFLAAPIQAGIVYDASADFDTMNNPSKIDGGVYSYGYTTSLGSSFSLLPTSFSGSLPGGATGPIAGYDLNGAVPLIGKNTSNSVYTGTQNGTTVTVQPGQLLLHPGARGQYADLRFTSPVPATTLLMRCSMPPTVAPPRPMFTCCLTGW